MRYYHIKPRRGGDKHGGDEGTRECRCEPEVHTLKARPDVRVVLHQGVTEIQHMMELARIHTAMSEGVDF